MAKKRKSIKNKIIFYSIFLGLAAIGIRLIFNYFEITRVREEVYQTSKNELFKSLDKQLQEKINLCIISVASLKDNDFVKQSLKTGKREIAIAGINSIIQNYKNDTEFHTTRIHIHTADRKSFVRSWAVDKYGDDLYFRKDIKKAFETKKIITGFDAGVAGVVARAVYPIFEENTYIGSIEVIQGLNSVFRSFEKEQFEFLLLMDEKHSSIAKATGLKENRKIQNYHLIQNDFNPSFLEDANKIDFQKLFHEKQFISEKYYYTFRYIEDIEKNIQGVFLIGKALEHVEKILNQSKQGIYITTLFMILLVVFLVSVFILIVNKIVVNPLNYFNSIFMKGAKGDLEISYPLHEINCSQKLNCGKKECPLYGTTNNSCFMEVGSHAKDFGKPILCPSILSGKYKTCDECNIYQQVVKDEIEEMASIFNTFMGHLKSIIQQIIEGNDQIHYSVSEIREGNQNLAQRVDSQSSSLEQTAAAIEEMGANIKSSAENTSLAKTVMHETMESTSNGNIKIKEAASFMGKTASETVKIKEVVKIIEGIAFQTNILALNAAVEAARAKEHGKGFAVVANEVRSLAQKTTDNAKQISSMIETIVKNIEQSNRMVSTTTEDFVMIHHNIEKTSRVINEINDSAREQEDASIQIEQAVTHLDELNQNNSSLVQEIASASEELEKQTEEMIQTLSFFKINRKSF
ncbi:MAG: hypothetical protein A2Y41_02380 [Spirochaetes bacterium GWB1_36_13]|nr:MAG: hypothetical protein A2Y41_02380 [Spirochaetes bacterium GWB1_36_13]